MRALVGLPVLFLALSCSSFQDNSEEFNLGGIKLGGYVFADTILGEMSWDEALLSCDTFSANGYYDWYLPEKYAFRQAYAVNRNPDFSEYYWRIPGNFLEHIYWTSTEDWSQWSCFDFVGGKESGQDPSGHYQVWPVRKPFILQHGDKVLSIKHCLDTLLPIVDNPDVFYSANADLPVKHWDDGTEFEIAKYLKGQQFVARQIVQTESGSFIQGKFYPVNENYQGLPLSLIFNRNEFDYFFILPNEWHKSSLISESHIDIQFVPKSNDSRILNSPDFSSLHPDWMPPSYIGLSFTFIAKKELNSNGGEKYYQGDLLGPQGNIVTKNCYIIADEWE